MSDVKATVGIDEEELEFIDELRAALSEPDHDARMRAIGAVRHLVTANRLAELFDSPEYAAGAGLHDYPFVRWAAESAAERHLAMEELAEVQGRYMRRHERKLNVAEELGFRIFETVKDRKYKGLYTRDGLIERICHQARGEDVSGGRDKDTVRELWKSYRGVVHLGMAVTYLEENPDQNWHPLLLAEFFQELLSSNCPKGGSLSRGRSSSGLS